MLITRKRVVPSRLHLAANWGVILRLAFQSIGVVYGDIGTSPLYVYSSTFSKGIKHTDDIIGVLSLIYFTLTLLPLIKYVFIVLHANDNGKGIAVVFAETITSSFMVLVMTVIWKKHFLLVMAYIVFIMSIEVTYLSSVLYKFTHGGYLPLAFATVAMTIMYTWNYVYRKKYYYEVDHKVSSYQLRDIAAQSDLCRIPGLSIFYSELVHGIPPIFEHYASNIPALHSVLVFVSFKSLPISKIPPEERFLFRRGQPRELYVFRCVVRHGYTDVHQEEEPFERLLIERVKDFVREQHWLDSLAQKGKNDSIEREAEEDEDGINNSNDEGMQAEGEGMNNGELERETEVLEKAYKAGVVHLMGESQVVAGKGAGLGKKVLINCGYNFLKKNLRQTDKMFDVPRKRLLKIGMTYEL
ncbi:hypothetical protein Ancab_019491 [Ancistrocladus abbreviatus]